MFHRSHAARLAAFLLASFAGTLAPAIASAADAPSPAPAASASALPEIGRVSAADRHDEPLRAAVRSTFVVTKAEMVRRGDATVADALTHVPGLSVQRSGPLGTQADLTMDGYRTKQIVILVDGRPAAGAQIEFDDLGTFSTAGVERIEVVEGGGASLYGTGALGGTVNIVTAQGRRGSLAMPRVALMAGSFGERAFTFENGIVSFERRTVTNSYAYPALGNVPAGTEQNADYSTTTVRAAHSIHAGSLRIDGTAGLTSNALGVPGDADFPPLSTTARQRTSTADARVGIVRTGPRAVTTLELSGSRRSALYTFSPNDPAVAAGNIFGAPGQLTQEGRAQVSLRTVIGDDAGNTVAGIDLARGVARVDAGTGAPGDPAVLPFAQSAVYVQQTAVAASGARAYAGIRAERDGAAGGSIAPSLGGLLPLGGGLALRANVATGFRAPDAVELAFPGFSNPALRPERTRGGDLALVDDALLGGASLRWFTQSGRDLIAINPAFDFSQPPGPANQPLMNVARFSIAGFVGALRTKPYHGVTTTLGITDTYRALDLTAAATRLARRPVVTADVALEYAAPRGGGLESAGILAHASGPHDTRVTEYARVDAYVRVRVASHALLSLRATNLGNERYADVAGYPNPGRGFALELATR